MNSTAHDFVVEAIDGSIRAANLPELFMPTFALNTGARFSILVLAWCGLVSASASSINAEECTVIADREVRLACYDAAFRKTDETSTSLPERTEESVHHAAPVDIEDRPAPASTSRSDDPASGTGSAPASGFGAEQLAQRRDTHPGDNELLSAITAMGVQATGRHWFRLTNGQVWSQVSPQHTALQAGDAVRISRGILGTYHLRQADGVSRSTAVRRLE